MKSNTMDCGHGYDQLAESPSYPGKQYCKACSVSGVTHIEKALAEEIQTLVADNPFQRAEARVRNLEQKLKLYADIHAKTLTERDDLRSELERERKKLKAMKDAMQWLARESCSKDAGYARTFLSRLEAETPDEEEYDG